MATTPHLEMQGAHLRFRTEYDFWRDEVVCWECEVSQAIKDLPRLEAALGDHSQSLRKHAATISSYEQAFSAYEHARTEYELAESNDKLVGLAQELGRTTEKHAAQRQHHENAKRQHHDLMARWRLLTMSLIPSQPSPPH